MKKGKKMERLYPMTRKERQMSDDNAKRFLYEGKVGRLGLCHGGEPYVVPVFYVYDLKEGQIFIHAAKKGRKIDAMSIDKKVCFEVDEAKELVVASLPCEYDFIYSSVIAFCKASFVEDNEKKANALNMIKAKYASTANEIAVTPSMAEGTMVIKLEIISIMGKENKGTIIPYSSQIQ
jgi:nitroimidazol reductase NimA-like FMN-containing flavoprotein (pyridoxamine 5'-phosphate oxidase superfamily)